MKKVLTVFFKVVLALVIIGVAFWFLGPRAEFEDVSFELPDISVNIDQLDEYLAEKESVFLNIKSENESRIVWADSIRKTKYALVYLHGFSAGPMEGAPLHFEVAKKYGMNLYLPRLAMHGLADEEAFLELSPEELMSSAKEALAIGNAIGENVIIMSCSTGSTLALYLSAHHPDIYANVMFSPNIDLYDPTTDMLTGPWGLQIIKQVVGDYRIPAAEEAMLPDSVRTKLDQYWTGKYRVEGVVALQGLIDQTMKAEYFEQIEQPYFVGYYYKNDTAQDMTVSVSAMLEFDKVTKTPSKFKRLVAFPEAGSHVINSDLTSKQFENVTAETFKYFEEVLGLESN